MTALHQKQNKHMACKVKDNHPGVRARVNLLLVSLVMFLVVYVTPGWGQDDFGAVSRGPIRIRNQFPLNLLFLGFAADDNRFMKRQAFQFDLYYSHSNTFVKSGGIVRHLQPQDGRGVLAREAAAQIAQQRPDEDLFLFDTETERWSWNVRYGLSDAVMLEAELPFLRFDGGFLDPVIERFHSTFGFPDDSRPDFRRNTSEAFFYIDRQFLYLGPDDLDGIGLGDLVLSSKFRLLHSSGVWPILTTRVAVKLPTGDPQKLRGSGSVDYGLSLIASKVFAQSCLHLNVGAVVPGKWQLAPKLNLSPIYSVLLSYERLVGKNASLIIQNLASSNVLTRATNSAIGKVSHEITVGVKMDYRQSLRWTFSLTENYAQYNNSPDIGFHLGVMYLL